MQLAIPVRHNNRSKLSQLRTAAPAIIKLKQGIYVEQQQQPDDSLPSQARPDALADALSPAATLKQPGSLPSAVQKLLPHTHTAPRVAKSPLQVAAAASRRAAPQAPKTWARATAFPREPLTSAAQSAAPLRQSHASAPLVVKRVSRAQSVAHAAAGSAERCAAREVEIRGPAKRQRHTAQFKEPEAEALPAEAVPAADTSTTPQQAAPQAMRSNSTSAAVATPQPPLTTAAGSAAAVAALQPTEGVEDGTAPPAAPQFAASAGVATSPTPPSAAAPAAGKAALLRPAIGTTAGTPPRVCSLPATSASAARPPSLARLAAAAGPDLPEPIAARPGAAAAAGTTANGRPRRIASKGVQQLVQAEAAIERHEQMQSWVCTRGEK